MPTPVFHPDDRPPAAGGAHVSLRSADALFALHWLLRDHSLVHRVASTYPTWDRLTAANPAEIAHLLGQRASVVRFPPACPPMPALPAGVAAVTRYTMTYPSTVREQPEPPVLLYVQGTLATVPALGVGGGDVPSMAGVEIARASALSAAIQGVPVVAVAQPGCGLIALRTAVEAGGVAVAVLPHGFGVISTHQHLLEAVVAGGGAVVAVAPPGERLSDDNVDDAARLVAGMSSAVVLAELGVHRTAGAPLARAVVRAGRYVIVPRPDAPAESGRYIAPSAYGAAVFASAKEWNPDYFGSGPRIDARCVNGLSPADAVVENQAELAAAIAVGCQIP